MLRTGKVCVPAGKDLHLPLLEGGEGRDGVMGDRVGEESGGGQEEALLGKEGGSGGFAGPPGD